MFIKYVYWVIVVFYNIFIAYLCITICDYTSIQDCFWSIFVSNGILDAFIAGAYYIGNKERDE